MKPISNKTFKKNILHEHPNMFPRIMFAGTHSGVGKTTIALSIMTALAKSGYKTQPFKVGPDYIDPSYHTMATGLISRNLDSWMLGENVVRKVFCNAARSSDISVIEGVMGLYDGSPDMGSGSSAHIAKILECPVILVLDVKSMAQSAAAVLQGYVNFDPGVKIAGVILNRVGSARHLRIVTESIESRCNIPVLGYVNLNSLPQLPSRHLGLIPAEEKGDLTELFYEMAEKISQTVDINRLVQIALAAPEMDNDCNSSDKAVMIQYNESKDSVKIGIARDKAFSFYYEDSLNELKKYGAELVPFSLLDDNSLPEDLDGIFIGGGFPELFINQLADNTGMKADIYRAGIKGMPIYAECGGLMYLAREITDFDGMTYSMAGLVPASCRMQKKLVGMGYVEATSLSNSIISEADSVLRGHEFHYSHMEPDDKKNFQYAYNLRGSRYQNDFPEGYASDNILASYIHLHFLSMPGIAERFVQKCRIYKESKANINHQEI